VLPASGSLPVRVLCRLRLFPRSSRPSDCAGSGWTKLKGQLGARFPAMTQVIYQLGRFRRLDAARSQIRKNLYVGPAGVHHPSGKFYIR
jgi:hypothetical protein